MMFAGHDNLRVIGILLLSIAFSCGCRDTSPSASKARDRSAEYRDAARRTATQEEAVAFSETFTSAVHAGDLERINELIDWHAIFVESTNYVDVPDETRRSFVQEGKDMIRSGSPGEYFAALDGGIFKALRVRSVGDKTTVLFRAIAPDGGIEYCEMPVVTTRWGETKADDIYFYSSGEGMADGVRKMLELAGRHLSNTLESGKVDPDMAHQQAVLEFIQATRNGECERAMEIYNRLPSNIQNEKRLLITRIRATSLLDEKQHLAAILEFCAIFPDDPAADIHAIQGHLLTQRYARALEGIDRLDQKVGGDPYLDVMRADACYNAGDFDDAKRFAQRAVDAEPELEGGYWLLVKVSLEQKKFSDTLEPLSVLEQQFGVEIDDETFAEFPDFIESDEYQDWKEKRSVRAAEASSETEN